MIPPPPRSKLFPYTTLFRSHLFALLLVDVAQLFMLLFGQLQFACHALHMALVMLARCLGGGQCAGGQGGSQGRSEEHTSELQSRPHLVCRLLLEKKKKRLAE